jgi:hypothetical protein
LLENCRHGAEENNRHYELEAAKLAAEFVAKGVHDDDDDDESDEEDEATAMIAAGVAKMVLAEIAKMQEEGSASCMYARVTRENTEATNRKR